MTINLSTNQLINSKRILAALKCFLGIRSTNYSWNEGYFKQQRIIYCPRDTRDDGDFQVCHHLRFIENLNYHLKQVVWLTFFTKNSNHDDPIQKRKINVTNVPATVLKDKRTQ